MSYFLADADGPREEFASIGGYANFRAWALRQAAPVRRFVQLGFSEDLDELADALAEVEAPGNVDEQRRLLLEVAQSANEIVIVSDGMSDEDEPRALARPKPTVVHEIADRFVPKIQNAVQYAFAKGRKAVKTSALQAASTQAQARAAMSGAVTATAKTLRAVLPKVLHQCLVASGEAQVAQMRAAGGPGSGNFGHAGRPGEVGGSASGGGDQTIGKKLWDYYAESMELSPEEAEQFLDERDDIGLAEEIKTLTEMFVTRLDAEELKRLTRDQQTIAFRGPLELATADDTDVVYHGTTETAASSIIANKMLKPRGEKRGNWESGPFGGNPSNPELVYVTPTRKGAEIYAEEIAQKVGGKPAVVRLKPNWDHATPDEDVIWDIMDRTRPSKMTRRGLRTAKDAPEKTFGPLKMSFSTKTKRAIEWAEDHAAELIEGISETTQEAIKAAIVNAFTGGGTLRSAYEDILAAVGDESRANTIARTESMRAANGGQREAWHQAVENGLLPENVRRQWIYTDDGSACDECTKLDGKTTRLDGTYPFDGGEGPPLHPNCRCTEGIIG